MKTKFFGYVQITGGIYKGMRGNIVKMEKDFYMIFLDEKFHNPDFEFMNTVAVNREECELIIKK